jgi:hypothetical protein
MNSGNAIETKNERSICGRRKKGTEARALIMPQFLNLISS